MSLVLAKAEVPMVLTAGPTLSVPLFNDLAAGGTWPLLLQRVLRVCSSSTAEHGVDGKRGRQRARIAMLAAVPLRC